MKSNVKIDITRSVISSDTMRRELSNIFTDSIILDHAYCLVSVSDKISSSLGYIDSDLIGRPISTLLAAQHEAGLLSERLQSGFFQEWPVQLTTAQRGSVMFSMSGFHLGLISDIDDLIVLKLTNLEELRLVYDRLVAKEHEIDDFVYHSAHSLRGPLATLKGLINLARICDDHTEMQLLIQNMDVFAQRLDDKLSKLVGFAKSGKIPDISSSQTTLSCLGDKLGVYVSRESVMPTIYFEQHFHDPEALIDKSDLVFGILLNIVSCYLQQGRENNSRIVLSSVLNNTFMEFRINTKGIWISDTQKKKLEDVNFGYVNILNEPELYSLYAAKKIIQKLEGHINCIFPDSEECSVQILIPIVSL